MIRPRATPGKIRRLVREEYLKYDLSDESGEYWWRGRDGSGRSRSSAAARDRDLANHVAHRVLERIGITDWSKYPWHKVASDGAEAIVKDVVERDRVVREADRENEPYDGLIDAVRSSIARRSR